jgi:hypothetical protein
MAVTQLGMLFGREAEETRYSRTVGENCDLDEGYGNQSVVNECGGVRSIADEGVLSPVRFPGRVLKYKVVGPSNLLVTGILNSPHISPTPPLTPLTSKQEPPAER